MARAFGPAVLVAASLLAFAAHAAPDVERPTAVVELYTSQGCSSCPPADKLLAQIAGRGDVVALGFHVDYWDYLGWKDTLARPENTERQRDYARVFANRSVYTPQVIVNGTSDLKGSSPARVHALLERATSTGALPVEVELEFSDDSLMIDIGAAPAREQAVILIVYFARKTPVEIAFGSDRNRTHAYVHPVTSFHSAGMWSGKAEEMRMPLHDVRKKGSGGVAVLVQEINANGLPGEIRGAALIHHP